MNPLFQIFISHISIANHLQAFISISDCSSLCRVSQTARTIFNRVLLDHNKKYQTLFMESLEFYCLMNQMKTNQKKEEKKDQKNIQKKDQKKEQKQDQKQEQNKITIVRPLKMVRIPKNVEAKFRVDEWKSKITKIDMKYLPAQFQAEGLWNLVTADSLETKYGQKFLSIFASHKQCNLFFTSYDSRYILSINRTLIDRTLNYEEPEGTGDESETVRQQLQQISESKQFDASQYDLSSMQDIVSRQKKILQQIDSSKRVHRVIQQQYQVPSLLNIQSINQYAVVLCHGGYFATGVFNRKGQCIFHKSDHKYVVRGKQGKRQLNKDSNCGSNVQSMGSQIRRDQEKKHQANVSSILNEAFDILSSSDIILLQAPGLNSQLLIQNEEPLFKLRGKLRSICVTSKKANYTEVERIQESITKVTIVEILEDIQDLQDLYF